MIVIQGRRWFQRSTGNTYHSVYVHEDGELIGSVPFAYGRDAQYLMTALQILQNAGKFPKTDERLPSGCTKDYGDFMDAIRDQTKFFYTAVDVQRKKDL